MTEDQGDKVIELLEAISDKLSEVLNRQVSTEELLEPWGAIFDNIAAQTEGAERQLGRLQTDIRFIAHVSEEWEKKISR
jgi:hemoglobin-like flavoprotein